MVFAYVLPRNLNEVTFNAVQAVNLMTLEERGD